MSEQHEMLRRVAAAQATKDAVVGTSFRFGRADCVRMVAAHLRRLGYRVRLPAAGSYATASGAAAALKDRGYASIAAALDAIGLERVTPAAALVGDIVQGRASDPLGALGVVLGNGRIIGWAEGFPDCAVLQMHAMELAWRATPR